MSRISIFRFFGMVIVYAMAACDTSRICWFNHTRGICNISSKYDTASLVRYEASPFASATLSYSRICIPRIGEVHATYTVYYLALIMRKRSLGASCINSARSRKDFRDRTNVTGQINSITVLSRSLSFTKTAAESHQAQKAGDYFWPQMNPVTLVGHPEKRGVWR